VAGSEDVTRVSGRLGRLGHPLHQLHHHAAGVADLEEALTPRLSLDGSGDRYALLLEPGKLADVVAFDGNPLDDLRALARPRLVMKGGAIVVDALSGERGSNP
jgi:hypothetical protein